MKQLPEIDGKPEVGRVLSLKTPLPDTPHDIQWTRDGRPIAGATSSSYRVTAADAGHSLSVEITTVLPRST